MAVPDHESESFHLARVVSCSDVEVTLIELKPMDVGAYKADIRSSWQEIPSACIHVDCDYDADSNMYRLRTPIKEIIK